MSNFGRGDRNWSDSKRVMPSEKEWGPVEIQWQRTPSGWRPVKLFPKLTVVY